MGWIIFVVKLNGFLLIVILWCLIYMFSWLIVIFVLCIMSVLCCAFHARRRMSQWQLLVTLWCSLITLHLVVPRHSSYLHTTCTSVAHVNLLLTWFMYCGWVISLSKYHCALISLTKLYLIKLMFVSCGSALGSQLCVCSFVDVSTFLSRKRAYDWCSIIPCFKTDSLLISRLKQWEIQDSFRFTNTFQHFLESSYCGGTSGQIWYLRNYIYP